MKVLVAPRVAVDGIGCPAVRAPGGHCKAMAPAWSKLGAHYGESDKILIAEVDCTASPDLCTQLGVESYPTLKFVQGGYEDLEEYEGELDADTLISFAKENLKPACTATAKDGLCTAEQLKQLNEFLQMSADKRRDELARITRPLKDAEAKLKVLEDKMEKLEEKVEEQEEAVDTLKKSLSPTINLLKSALAGGPAPGSRPDARKDEV